MLNKGKMTFKVVVRLTVGISLLTLAGLKLFDLGRDKYVKSRINSPNYENRYDVETVNVLNYLNQTVISVTARDTASGTTVTSDHPISSFVLGDLDPELHKATMDKVLNQHISFSTE